jgi:hypothetical protein
VPLVGPLPTRGIWTAIGLGRGQFLGILALSVAAFLLVDGPLWHHLRDSHFDRIALSYGIIPPLVGAALWRNGRFRPLLLLEASAVISLVKLVLTALLLMVFAL